MKTDQQGRPGPHLNQIKSRYRCFCFFSIILSISVIGLHSNLRPAIIFPCVLYSYAPVYVISNFLSFDMFVCLFSCSVVQLFCSLSLSLSLLAISWRTFQSVETFGNASCTDRKSLLCGVGTHAQLPAVDLESTPLTAQRRPP